MIFIISILMGFDLVAQPGFGKSQKIDSNWKFILKDEVWAKDPSFDDENWESVTLPHDWSVKQPLDSSWASATGYLPGGIGWYRRTLNIPKERMGNKIYLYFEGVYNRSKVYVNGYFIGKRESGYTSFLLDITPYVNYGEDNVIAVRVDHSRYADSRWYTGSGIYQDVWLTYSNPLHIAKWGTYAYPERKGEGYVLKVETTIENHNDEDEKGVEVLYELSDPAGKVVLTNHKKDISIKKAEGVEKVKMDLQIKSPKLWSLNSPDLYTLATKIKKEGKTVDSSTIKTGFRTFEFDPDHGFYLNGENMKMKGVSLHHDAGVLGAAVPKDVWRKRLIALKNIGVNAVRTTHNPRPSYFYDLTDELGLLVIDEAFDEWEFPKRKWIEGWNVGTPGWDGSFDVFEEYGEKDLADMVKRDRNHTSIFTWSIGNEVDYPNDPYSHIILDGDGDFTQRSFGGFKKEAPNADRLGEIAESLVKVVKKYDKSRPTTAGLAGVAMSNETRYPGAVDIVGYNYTEDRYQEDHKKYPKRVIYGSENRHDIEAWHAVTENDFIFGQFLWTGIDYLGESGRWPSRGFYSGLFDLAGNLKPRGYFRKSLWSDKPMIYLGTYSVGKGKKGEKDVLSAYENKEEPENLSIDAWPDWNYDTNEIVRVVAYTNTEQAQLKLNGKSIGEPKSYDSKTGIIYWDLPYEKGELKVEGLDENGNKIAEYKVATEAEPTKIKTVDVDSQIDLDSGISMIRIRLIDKHGNWVANDDKEIVCNIEGPGELLGLEAANNSDMGDYTDNKQKTYRGKLLAYIKAKNKGIIKINFDAEGIDSEQVEINVQ